jgi:hypothetical protein
LPPRATLFSQVRLCRPPASRSAPVQRGVSLAPHDGARMVVTELPVQKACAKR